jgi:hypothetical protein
MCCNELLVEPSSRDIQLPFAAELISLYPQMLPENQGRGGSCGPFPAIPPGEYRRQSSKGATPPSAATQPKTRQCCVAATCKTADFISHRWETPCSVKGKDTPSQR